MPKRNAAIAKWIPFSLVLGGTAGLLGQAAPAGAAEVLFAGSSGDWMDDDKPGLYSALNVLDGDPKTVWCSSGSGQDAWLEIQFDEPVTIDRFEIRSGNQQSPAAFKAFNRIKQMSIFGGEMTQPVELADQDGVQKVDCDPVVETDRLVFRLKAGYRGQKRHTCISDITLFHGRRAHNSSKIKKAIAAVRKKREFIDAWVAGPEMTKTHRLLLGIDDKFSLRYIPLDPTESQVRKEGEYRVQAGAPELKVDRKWIPIKVSRDDAGRLLKMKISGLDKLDGIYIRRREAPAERGP